MPHNTDSIGKLHGKHELLLLSLLFAFLLGEVVAITHLTYMIKNDNGPMLFYPAYIYNGLFIWNSNSYTGLPTIAASIPWIFVESIGILIAAVVGNAVAYTIVLWLELCIGALGVYMLVNDTLSALGAKNRYIGGFAGALLFTTPVVQFNYFGPAIFLPITLYFLIRLVQETENGCGRHRYLFMAAASGAVLLAYDGASEIVQNAILFAIVTTVLILTSRNKTLLAKSLLIAIAIVLMMNVSWMANPMFFRQTSYHAFISAVQFRPTGSIASSSALIDMFAFAPFMLFELPFVLFVLLAIVLIISVFALGRIFTTKEFMATQIRTICGFICAYLVLVALAAVTVYPLTYLNGLYSAVPYLFTVEVPWVALSFAAITLFSVLFGVGAGILSTGVLAHARRLALPVSLLLLILPIVIFYLGLLNTTSNDWGSLYHIYTSYGIPSYVMNASAYLNQRLGNFGIATLPTALGWQMTTWYTGTNIYSDLIYEHPVFTGGVISSSQLLNPQTAGIYDSEVGIPVSSGDLSPPGNISRSLGVLGIKYVLLQTDAIDNPKCWCANYPFNLSAMEKTINTSGGLTLDARFGDALIYKNNNYAPLVYSARLVDLGNVSVDAVFNYIDNGTFGINNTAIYSSNPGLTQVRNTPSEFVANSTSFSGAIPTPVNGTLPMITYLESSPVSLTVHVHNATSPYYLILRESYNPSWALRYQNGTNASTIHLMANGFENAWYINKPGSYELTLYYTPQTIEWITWMIGLIGACLLGALGYKTLLGSKGEGKLLGRTQLTRFHLATDLGSRGTAAKKGRMRRTLCVWLAAAPLCFILTLVAAWSIVLYQNSGLIIIVVAMGVIGVMMTHKSKYVAFALVLGTSLLLTGAILYFHFNNNLLSYKTAGSQILVQNISVLAFFAFFSATISFITKMIDYSYGTPLKRTLEKVWESRYSFSFLAAVSLVILVSFFLPVWLGNIPITHSPHLLLTLGQASEATSGNYLLLFNASAYAGLELPELSNIRFTYDNGTQVPAYIPRGYNFANGTVPVWLEPGKGGSGQSIRLYFMPFYVNRSSGLSVATTPFPTLPSDTYVASKGVYDNPEGNFTNITYRYMIFRDINYTINYTVDVLPYYLLQTACAQGTNDSRFVLSVTSDHAVSILIFESMAGYQAGIDKLREGGLQSYAIDLNAFLPSSNLSAVNVTVRAFNIQPSYTCVYYLLVADNTTRVRVYVNSTGTVPEFKSKSVRTPDYLLYPIYGTGYVWNNIQRLLTIYQNTLLEKNVTG